MIRFKRVASVLAGLLWDRLGPASSFYGGAGFCVLAMGLLWWPSRAKPGPR